MARDIPTGIVFFDGPSEITGEPILGIMTGFKSTHNRKTGEMLQTWILDKKDHPVEAIQTGNDENVCGSCPARGKYCYVSAFLGGPNAVYNAWQNGSYVKAKPKHLGLISDKVVRLGSYGSPSAIPIDIWHPICAAAQSWLGYTHDWKTCDKGFQKYCMASVETPEDALTAQQMGWRTFRVKLEDEPLLKNEFTCPASKEFKTKKGYSLQCHECRQCSGGEYNQASGRKTPVINIHGTDWKTIKYKEYRQELHQIRLGS